MGRGKQLPIERRIAVKDIRFPRYDGPCHLCEGELKAERIDFTIVRDYDEVYAEVVLAGLPVLFCSKCHSEWILEDVAAGLDDQVQSQFEDILATANTTR